MEKEIHEEFTKETKVVVIFDHKFGTGRFNKDCSDVRNILGKAFPMLLMKNQNTKKEVAWLVDRDYNTKIRNLTELEDELKIYGIQLSYLHSVPGAIQVFPNEDVWKYYIGSYLEYNNKELSDVVTHQVGEGNIQESDVAFSLRTVSVKTPAGEVDGNYFTVITRSNRSEESLKSAHKLIIQELLKILESIDEIIQISYQCGDIEHEVVSKISCVLD